MNELKPKKNQKWLAISVFFVAVFVLYSFYLFPGDENKKPGLIAKARLFNEMYPNEKLYLHLDRPTYRAGDDIWFKAYLVNSFIPECNVYVEVLNSTGKVLNKDRCWAQNGLAYGNFHLVDTLSAGVYQIRAYTDWMRNFDNRWFFRKNLVIWGAANNALKARAEKMKSSDMDLQFFPEGGTFIAGLENRVAFKATDKNGKGLPVEGEITDKEGNKIVDFKSRHNGMGSFVFVPAENEQYTAKAVLAENWKKKVDLPKPVSTGVKLSANADEPEKIMLEISTNSDDIENNQEYNIAGQSGGENCFFRKISLTGNNTTIEVEKDSLPTGIIQFTLFNDAMIPLCERLVFVNHHDYIPVKIQPDKPEYKTREKVVIDVKTFTNDLVPKLSNLSLSVYNPQNQLEIEKYPENILTRFLLGSELKGTIEDPAWYFKDDSVSTQQTLDLLMLTHGYRYFSWEEIRDDQAPVISYPPENSIRVWGRVTHVLTGKPISDTKVTLLFLREPTVVNETTTDSLGFFIFDNFFFTDTVNVVVQAGKNRKRRNFWVQVDNRSWISPVPDYLPVNYQYVDEKPVNTTYYLVEENSDLINRKWHLNDTIVLGDINIMAQRPREATIHIRPYLDADYVFDVTTHDFAIYNDITELLNAQSAYIRMFYDKNPQYFLDGVMVDSEFVQGLPASWFEKVEAVKLSPVRNGFGPGLFFYTKRGEKQQKSFEGIGKTSSRVVGYSVVRKFYSPNYDKEQLIGEHDDKYPFLGPGITNGFNRISRSFFFYQRRTRHMAGGC